MSDRLIPTLFKGLTLYCVAFCGYVLYIYLFTDDYPGEGVGTSFYFIFYIGVALLITFENRGTKIFAPVYDVGFLLYLFMPVLLPYYLYKSRGYAGLVWMVPVLFVIFIETIGYEMWTFLILEE